MEIETEIKAVRDTFDAFVSAVKDSNFSSYLSLHSADVASDVNEELFVRNCARAKAHSFDFDLERIEFDGRFATVHFLVKPGDGAEEHKDEAELTMCRDDENWKLYEI